MKKLVLLFLVCVCGLANAGHLSSLSSIKEAIAKGKQVNLSIKVGKCVSLNAQQLSAPDVIGSFTPNTILAVKDDYVVTSNTHLTLGNPFHPNKTIYENTVYKIFADGKVTLTVNILDAKTLDKLNKEAVFNCTLNDSVNVYSK